MSITTAIYLLVFAVVYLIFAWYFIVKDMGRSAIKERREKAFKKRHPRKNQ